MSARTLSPEGDGLSDSTSRVCKPLPSKRVLKTLTESPKKQYMLLHFE